MKVLIIEDRRENIVFIANNILKPQGYEVITARDGLTGLAKAQEEAPDIIITDLKLPRMNGLEVLEKLNNKGFNIPAIVMTFHGSEESARQALRLGARDYLIKPFTIEELQEAIARALRPVTNSRAQNPEMEAKLGQLEQNLAQTRAALTERENQIGQMKRYLAATVKKSEVVQLARQAETWEKDNARLHEALTQTRANLSKTEARAQALEEAVEVQKAQMSKYQQEARRLAEELRNLSEAFRLMSQDLSHQVELLEVLTPTDAKPQRGN
jgi:DNA-binding response OmpR family regulator